MRILLVAVKPRLWPMLALAIGLIVVIGALYSVAQAPGQPEPLGPLSDNRIAIDPGHGGVDGGCSHHQFLEKELNLAVGKTLAKNLAALGGVVQLTRTSDEALVPWGAPGGSRHKRDLAARIQVSKDFAANIFLSIHANAGPAHLGGALVFYHQGDVESRRLAGLVQERLEKLVPGNQNGILPAKFMVLAQQQIPAVLIELGFLTHPQDRQFLMSETAPVLLAEEITAGVTAYIQGDEPVAPTISPYPIPSGDDPDLTLNLPYPGCLVVQPYLLPSAVEGAIGRD